MVAPPDINDSLAKKNCLPMIDECFPSSFSLRPKNHETYLPDDVVEKVRAAFRDTINPGTFEID